MSLRIWALLVLALTAPALAEEAYVREAASIVPVAPADRALLYFARLGRPAVLEDTDAMYVDANPVALLPKDSYAAVSVEPGLRLVWWSVFGSFDGHWFALKPGRAYLLRAAPASGAWYLDDPQRLGELIAQRRLVHVRATAAGLQAARGSGRARYDKLRRRSWQLREQALRAAGREGKDVLPLATAGVAYKPSLGRFKEPGYWGDFGELTIDATRVRWQSPHRRVEIPVAEMHRVFFAGLSFREHAAWIGIEYGPAPQPQRAFFHSPTDLGFLPSYNRKFAALVEAMRAAVR